MNRRKARELALKALYGREFAEEDDRDMTSDTPANKETATFSRQLIKGASEHIAELDELIAKAAEHWKLDRMATVDRNILRLAAYELIYMDDIPTAVTINEAIEIAKKYSTAESAAFINGILDRLAKNRK